MTQQKHTVQQVTALFFSPTHTTQKVVCALAQSLAQELGCPVKTVSWTLPQERTQVPSFGPQDVLVLGFPVYAGRIPALLDAPLGSLTGNGAQVVPVAVYGNRDYDDALLEAYDLLEERGFQTVGAGAFIGEHSDTALVAHGRPSEEDLLLAREFGKKLAQKVLEGQHLPAEALKGNRPYKERRPGGHVEPKTTKDCTDCMFCANHCPVGAIDKENPRVIHDGCIRCCACVKGCPEHAKYFDDKVYAQIRGMLLTNCLAPKQPELFGI